MTGQIAVPCVMMRGGTSKGAYFLAADLPAEVAARDAVLLAAMGSPDPRQIDGIGGADPLTSKVAIVSRATRPDADIDYLFAQVVIDQAVVDTAPNCGNILAGIAPFAIDAGLFPAQDGRTAVRIHMVNSGKICIATVATPGGRVTYEGSARIAGVPGTAAPVMLEFLDVAGSTCGALLPTGRVRDEIDGVAVTCIDNGMPVVVLRADALGRSGYEGRDALNSDDDLKARLEAIRLQAGPLMGLGDVTDKVVPKMSLLAPPREGGAVCSRTFIPHVCHSSIGVLGAVSVATACMLQGSPAAEVAALPARNADGDCLVSVEHPTGEFSVELATAAGAGGQVEIRRAALLRTARRLFQGAVLIPAGTLGGRLDAAVD